MHRSSIIQISSLSTLLIACASNPIELRDIIATKQPIVVNIQANIPEIASYHDLRFRPEWMISNSKLNSILKMSENEDEGVIKLGIYGGWLDGNPDWTMCVMVLKSSIDGSTEVQLYDGGTSARCPEFFAPLLRHPNRI